MKILRKYFLLILLIFYCGIIHAQSKGSSSFFIIQLTDPQFGFFDENRSFDKESLLYKEAIDEVNTLHPAFLVITGDLVHNAADISQHEEFDRITALLDPAIPVYFLPGNHDIGNKPSLQSINAFKKAYGNDKFSFQFKKNSFIGINTCIICEGPPNTEEEQFLWLGEELEKAKKSKNIVVFGHYSFFLEEPEEPDAYFNVCTEKRKKYLELFQNYKVKAIFAGHYHRNAYGYYNNLDMVTTSAVGKPLGDDPSGFRIIVISKKGVSSKYYSLDEIPIFVDFNITDHK